MWSLVRAVSQPWISDDVNPTIRAAWNRLRQGEAPPEVFATMQLEAVNAEKATRAERGLD